VLGKIDDVAVGDGEVVRGPNGERYVVVRTSTDEVEAFSARCTHKGCQVSASDAGKLACPCHGSVFDLHTGAVIEGPAQRPLAKVAVTVRDGEIRLA
jgi:Rieske Fe-S protein